MERQRWTSRTIFLFAAIGAAVGLGNVWRFPYLTYKFGGGAFLIPYLIALFVIGIPMLLLEFAIGQKIQKGAVGSFRKLNPKLRGVGYAAIFSSFMVVTYYMAVLSWSLVFFVNSFQPNLPWAEDSSSYFFNDVLQITSSAGSIGGINLTLLAALVISWIAVFLCIRKGVKSVGKVVTWTMPLPIILLVILFIRGMTLPGAFTGLSYYLKPDFSALLSGEIWMAAISQIFFTLSLAFGIMIAYASYNKKNQNVRSDTYITAISNSAISIFAGFVVFSILGFMATSTGIGVEDVATAGPGLAFVVFPQALSLLPFWAPFFAILFFLALLTLGIDSAFSLVEAINAMIADNQRGKPNYSKISAMVSIVGFAVGLIYVTGAGLYFLDIIDHFVTNYSLIIVGILEAITIGWIYGADNLRDFINSVSKRKTTRIWNFFIKFIIPIALTAVLITQLIKDIVSPYEGYPAWALSIGWAVAALTALIFIFFLFKKE